MSDIPKFAQRHLIENQRIAEIKKLADQELKIVYEDKFLLPINHPDRIVTSWWLYLLWSDKKNNRPVRFPSLFDFRIENFHKIKFNPRGSYEDYIHDEL